LGRNSKDKETTFDVLCQDMLCGIINTLKSDDKKDIFLHIVQMIDNEQKPNDFSDKKTFFDRILLRTIDGGEIDDTTKNTIFSLGLWGAASRVSFSEDTAKKAIEKISKTPAISSLMRPYWAAVCRENQREFLKLCLNSISVQDNVDLVVSIGDCLPDFWGGIFEKISLEDGFFVLEKAGKTIKNQTVFFKEMLNKISQDENRDVFLNKLTHVCFENKLFCDDVFSAHAMVFPKNHETYPGWHINQVAFFERCRDKGQKNITKSQGGDPAIDKYLALCGAGKTRTIKNIAAHKCLIFKETTKRFDLNAKYLYDLANSFKNPLWSAFNQDEQKTLIDMLLERISKAKASAREKGALSLYFYREPSSAAEHILLLTDILTNYTMPHPKPLVDCLSQEIKSGRLSVEPEKIQKITEKQRLGQKDALELATAETVAQSVVRKKSKL